MTDVVAELRPAASPLDDATRDGLDDLMVKLEPLIQGRRLHNIVDLLSLVSDAVDMSDDAMVQKVMKTADDAVGGAWTLGNAARYAAAQTSKAPPPSLIGLLRAAGDEDVRRGLHFALKFLSVLGRQMRDDDR